MGAIRRQRQKCRELSRSVQADREALGAAGEHITDWVRAKAVNPLGLIVCFGIGCLASELTGRKSRKGQADTGNSSGHSPERSATGFWILRALEFLARH